MSQCEMCNAGIEGFTNDYPKFATQESETKVQVEEPFQPYMKSECNFAAQSCIYTAQGEMVCPKDGLGACSKPGDKKWFGMF